jgi:hypothetical protein
MLRGERDRDAPAVRVAHQVGALHAELVEEVDHEALVGVHVPGLGRRLALSEAGEVERDQVRRAVERREDRRHSLDVGAPAVQDHDRQVPGRRAARAAPHVAHLLRADPDGLAVL